MKHLFIINPKAGNGFKRLIEKDIKEIFRFVREYNPNVDYEIVYTKCERDATRIAKEYSDKEKCRIYAVGGDGTLNEVLNGMVNSDSSLGCIPMGTGNDFYRNISKVDRLSLIKNTVLGVEKTIDCGQINDYYFINIVGLGFDAMVNMIADKYKSSKIIPRKLSYGASIVKALTKRHSYDIELSFNGETFNESIFLLAICNGKAYGGGFNISPLSKINDGYFDIIMVNSKDSKKIPLLIPNLLKSTHINKKEVKQFKTKEIKIKCNDKVVLNIDGLVYYEKEFICKILENKVNFIYPKNIIE